MAPSTSAVATANKPATPTPLAPLADRVLVRRRAVSFVASRVAQKGEIETVQGTRVATQPGDWIITQGKLVLDVLPDKVFPGPFELVHEGGLLIPPVDREAIEAVAGIGACRSSLELVRSVQRLARIQIGGIDVPFTPGQLEELAARATKRGRTVQQELQAVVDRIRDELFWRG